MKAHLKFLIPNKKTALVFIIMTIIMSLASLHGEAFSENEPTILYRVFSQATGSAWGYGSVNDSLIAELRVEDNFGKYEFVYTCGDISEDVFPYVMIKNPSIEDIDNNPCW